ncbi:YfdX family protein [Methylobacterium sp. J-078]|uniref:YfdX family protein n=1 Tax=Methylobacterium sp. J-078 TaxID=2836657 RepID=UPI001FBA43BD|nr:YfdX family protein [Methylobacterium sp. J-078]MCJ2045031.1 YfdX family protein [Methylobacterium sp. J-078]
MTKTRKVAAFLAATSLLGGVAFANDAVKTPAAPPVSAAQQAADTDVGKLSKDGAQAFRDLHLARIAIFDADPTLAKDLIGKAQASLTKAKTDEAVYTKAEADLRGPAKPAGTTRGGDTAKANDPAMASTQPTAWLPVDGQLTLGEDFVATPTKAAAVATANKSLEKGDRKAAVDGLKLAGVDVNFVLAVVPLNQTTTEVDQAAKLIGQGQYYEGNALLKKVEDGVRFDVVDVLGAPQKPATPAAATASTAPQK